MSSLGWTLLPSSVLSPITSGCVQTQPATETTGYVHAGPLDEYHRHQDGHGQLKELHQQRSTRN